MNVFKLAGINVPETENLILPKTSNQFPFDNSKIDWQYISETAYSLKDNTSQMDRMLASKLLEKTIVTCSGGQFRYVGDDEKGVDFRVNGTDIGIELKTYFNLFQKNGSVKRIDFTSFRSAQQSADDFPIQCDYLLLIDKSPNKFRVRGTSKELLEKYRKVDNIFSENKSGIQAKIPQHILSDIIGPIQVDTHNAPTSPITEMIKKHEEECAAAYKERNCKSEFK